MRGGLGGQINTDGGTLPKSGNREEGLGKVRARDDLSRLAREGMRNKGMLRKHRSCLNQEGRNQNGEGGLRAQLNTRA